MSNEREFRILARMISLTAETLLEHTCLFPNETVPDLSENAGEAYTRWTSVITDLIAKPSPLTVDTVYSELEKAVFADIWVKALADISRFIQVTPDTDVTPDFIVEWSSVYYANTQTLINLLHFNKVIKDPVV